jgi:hypothetical protein
MPELSSYPLASLSIGSTKPGGTPLDAAAGQESDADRYPTATT